MALWIDKYRPQSLDELSYHDELTQRLREIVSSNDFPHLLLYGPSGAGKATRVRCILKALYGAGATKLRLETRGFTTPGGKKLEIQTVSSNYHIELTPSDVGIHDRIVVQEVIKQMAQTQQLNEKAQKEFKVVVLREVDGLSTDAQHALRRTMEAYSGNCRLILVCESLSRVIDPLRSRCMMLRVPAPSETDIASVIANVANAENVLPLPQTVMRNIIAQGRGNLRRSLLLLESGRAQQFPFQENQRLPEPEWEIYLRETAQMIIRKQSAEVIIQVRERLYEIISRCIPPPIIFRELLRYLLEATPPHAKAEVAAIAAEKEYGLTKGNKAIFHLEAFVAAFMDIYMRAREGH
ncbi:unnamed protein product, partial [Mesorhabditis spiculigera]